MTGCKGKHCASGDGKLKYFQNLGTQALQFVSKRILLLRVITLNPIVSAFENP